MTDDRHASDTFFLIAEADWRLYREHCVSDRNWMEEVDNFAKTFLLDSKVKIDPRPKAHPSAPVQPIYKPREGDSDDEMPDALAGSWNEEMMGEAAASSSGGAGPPRPGRPGSPAPKEGDAEWSASRGKPSFYGWMQATRHEAREAYITRDLKDLISIANVAHRYHYRGDVVWYSWSGKGKAKNKPSYGSTLVGVSKEGALKLKMAMENDHKPMHFDLWLKQKLYEKAHDLSGCYVFPAVGGFDEHLSGCDPTGAGPGGVREPLWDQKNQVGGVRIVSKTKNHEDRFVRAFLDQKGPGDWGVKVEFGDDDDKSLVWRTMQPPRHYWQGDEVWHDILHRRGWLTVQGYFKLPAALTAPRGHDDWRALEAAPDELSWNRVSKCFSPITRVAEHVVCTMPEDAERTILTKRQKTEHRLNLTMYKRRLFVDDFWQAA